VLHSYIELSLIPAQNARGMSKVKAATDIWLQPGNFNRDTRFPPSHSWHPLVNITRQIRDLKKHCKEEPTISNMNFNDQLLPTLSVLGEVVIA
jgi:hypothetical protein